MTTPIDALRPVTGYTLTDCTQRRVVRTYGPGARSASAAYRAADRLNQEWGAVRYGANPVIGKPVTQREFH